MTSTEVECPYHHRRWRGQLQCLLNGLRVNVLQDRHIKRFPSAVCVCTDKGRSSPHNQLSNLAETKAWFRSPGDGIPALKPVQPVIDRFVASASDESLHLETRQAIMAVLTVVKDACNGSYRQLEGELKQSQQEVNPRELNFDLDFPSCHLGVFLGRRGQHLKPISKKYSVSLKLRDSQSSMGSRGRSHISGSSVRVLVRCTGDGGQEKLEKVKEELKKRAMVVSSQREQHNKNVQEYYKRRAERDRTRWQQRLERDSANPGAYKRGVYRNPKEAARGHYFRKQEHKEKPSSSTKPPAFAAVSDGHCLHCKAPYAPKELHDGACTYHSGFIAPVTSIHEKPGYYWTCCDERTPEQHATYELHRDTGCQKGRHVWRPGKTKTGGGRDTKGDVGLTEDFYVT